MELTKVGNAIEPHDDWFGLKLEIMQALVDDKFIIHQQLCLRLIRTYPSQIVYVSNDRDSFWGTVNGQGDNQLGQILMTTRNKLWQIPCNREMAENLYKPTKERRERVSHRTV